tara:strand:- start:1240 stop:2811 length:1572 start_codon:yes stop_codon:yes gene_type:complete
LKKIKLLVGTLKHVKAKQIFYQVYYRVRSKSKLNLRYEIVNSYDIDLLKGLNNPRSYIAYQTFSFLNIKTSFESVDWNCPIHGKLWTYNLNYFDFLNQEELTKEEGLNLIQDFIAKGPTLKDALDPYPTSLRVINWVKFLSNHKIQDPIIDLHLHNDLERLSKSLEFHLLGNHLLENGFGLLFGAYYFQDEFFYKKAKTILVSELEEQILKDGAHYELSPLYHQIILFRVLDSYNLVINNAWRSQELNVLLEQTAKKMLAWLKEISWRNGEIPMLNDSASGITPHTNDLFEYAETLGLKAQVLQLKVSGYRKFDSKDFEVVMDVGQIAPSYQPGHSHADSLQFLLHFKRVPIIVDTGISTYEKNERRQLERSTESHNTVVLNKTNSSNVWSGFRVAERACVVIEEDNDVCLTASHNGYRKMGLIHRRSFSLEEGVFVIHDEVISKKQKVYLAEGHLHFHPNVIVKKVQDGIVLNDNVLIQFIGKTSIEIKSYQFALGFNRVVDAKKCIYTFNDKVVVQVKSYI